MTCSEAMETKKNPKKLIKKMMFVIEPERWQEIVSGNVPIWQTSLGVPIAIMKADVFFDLRKREKSKNRQSN